MVVPPALTVIGGVNPNVDVMVSLTTVMSPLGSDAVPDTLTVSPTTAALREVMVGAAGQLATRCQVPPDPCKEVTAAAMPSASFEPSAKKFLLVWVARPAVSCAVLVVVKQVATHCWNCSLQTLGAWHGLPVVMQPRPGWQVSWPVQNRPSSHFVLSGMIVQPWNSVHWSIVQSIPSLHGLPLLWQPSLGSQVSKPSQNRKSLHTKSSGTCAQSFKFSSQLSNVHEIPSSGHPGPPNLHPRTGSQTSRPSHNEPSSQRASLGLLTQAWIASSHRSSVQSTLSLL